MTMRTRHFPSQVVDDSPERETSDDRPSLARRQFLTASAASVPAVALVTPTPRTTALAITESLPNPWTAQQIPDEDLPRTYSFELVDEVITTLAAAGVSVFATLSDPAPIITPDRPGPFQPPLWRIERLNFKAINQGGQAGEALDALVIDPEMMDVGPAQVEIVPHHSRHRPRPRQ